MRIIIPTILLVLLPLTGCDKSTYIDPVEEEIPPIIPDGVIEFSTGSKNIDISTRATLRYDTITNGKHQVLTANLNEQTTKGVINTTDNLREIGVFFYNDPVETWNPTSMADNSEGEKITRANNSDPWISVEKWKPGYTSFFLYAPYQSGVHGITLVYNPSTGGMPQIKYSILI